MGTDGGRCPEMFLEPFPTGPCRFPYVLITLIPVTVIPVNYSTPAPTIRCQTIWYQVSLFTHPMVPCVVSIILVGIAFSHRPDKAILFVTVKACLSYKYILFFITFKELCLT